MILFWIYLTDAMHTCSAISEDKDNHYSFFTANKQPLFYKAQSIGFVWATQNIYAGTGCYINIKLYFRDNMRNAAYRS